MATRAIRLAILLLLLSAACGGFDPVAAKADALRRGQESFDRQQYGEAVDAFQVAVEQDPRDGDARLKLARAHHLAGNWPQAAEHGIKAADLLPGDEPAQLFAMSMMLVQSRFIDVAARASALLRKNPDHVQALLLAGNAAARLLHSYWALWKLDETMRLGRNLDLALTELRPRGNAAEDAEAARLFRRARELAPEDMEVRAAVVNHLWAMGQFDAAEPLLKQLADESPAYVLLNRALGLFYISRRRLPEAEKYLAAAAATGDRDARASLATLYTTTRPAEALTLLDALIREDDASGDLARAAAAVEVALGRRDSAMRRIDALLARRPLHAGALRLKAELLQAASQPEPALKLAEAAVSAEPRSRDGWMLLGRLLMETGHVERAFARFMEADRLDPGASDVQKELALAALALGRNEAALEHARLATRRNPGDRGATAALVTALIRTGDAAAADRALRPLLAREPGAPDLLLRSGQILAARGQRAAARSQYTRALQAGPDELEIIRELAHLDVGENQPAAARHRVEAALAARPTDTRRLLLAAEIYGAIGDAPRAETALRTILTQDPSHGEAAMLLANTLLAQKRPDEARQVLEGVLARSAGTIRVQLALAELLETIGDTAAARRQYERIRAAEPRVMTAAYRLASLYAAQGDRLDQALELARTAKEALPHDPAVSDTLGWVYVRRNLSALAIPHLEDAVRGAPGNARYRYHLGIAYLRVGRSHEAQTALTRALQLDSTIPEAPEARAALAAINR